jgi:hypothetical protein
MASHIFDTLTKVKVLEIQAEALALQSRGKTSWSSEGTAYSKDNAFGGLSIQQVLHECDDYLKRHFPAEYGRKITRTKASIFG